MSWRKYEDDIANHFKKLYPNCTITFDARIVGRYSMKERQIDVLIEDSVADNEFKIFIDAKYFNVPINVKQVECVLGMMDDIAADKGLIITKKGYSKAALNRAYYDPRRLELDVLNYEELSQYQGFGAVTYNGQFGAMISAPFGWIIDGSRRAGGVSTTLYQQGITFQEANKRFEFIYVRIVEKGEEFKDLEALIRAHENNTRDHYADAVFNYKNVRYREKENVTLRIITSKRLPHTEYTAFIDFDSFIFFAVLYSPEVVLERNLKKLKFLISTAKPLKTKFRNRTESALFNLETALKAASEKNEKLEILNIMRKIYIENKDDIAMERVQLMINEINIDS